MSFVCIEKLGLDAAYNIMTELESEGANFSIAMANKPFFSKGINPR